MKRILLIAILSLAPAAAAPVFDWQTPPAGFDFRTILLAPPTTPDAETQALLDLFLSQPSGGLPVPGAQPLLATPSLSLTSAPLTQPVPEPGSLLLAAAGLAAGAIFARARMRRS
ncbi:MAG: PEP-CTERM sorting domain-containing protein [Acidobacteria bacterium]|nr:PEP-CTERM sorting domain-containing protein [Acidobacteriota bacterium]